MQSGKLSALATAYTLYFREQRRCAHESCVMANKRARVFGLGIATLAVFTFTGFNLYTALATSAAVPADQEINVIAADHTQITIPVEGMTCVTCEIALEKSLNNVTGVTNTDASTKKKQRVTVDYDPGQVSVNALVDGINKTGYQAKLQQKE